MNLATDYRFFDIPHQHKRASLVMIDRETRHPYPRHQSKIKARQSLDRSFRRIRRDMPAFDEHHINIVTQSYRSCFNPNSPKTK